MRRNKIKLIHEGNIEYEIVPHFIYPICTIRKKNFKSTTLAKE